MIHEHTVTLLTESTGSGVAWIGPARGELLELSYVKTDYASGVDIMVATEKTGRVVWQESDVNASKTISLAASLAGTSGTAITNLYTTTFLEDDRLRIVVTDGGSGKIGTFTAKFREPTMPSPIRNPAAGVIA